MHDDIKRCSAKRMTALILDIIQGKTTVVDASKAYELTPSEMQEAYGDAMLKLRARKNLAPAGQRGRQMILELRRTLKDDDVLVSLVKLCGWFGVPHRPVYYKLTKGEPKVKEHFVNPIKVMIEEYPNFGYRNVANLANMNKNTVKRVFRQVRKQPDVFGPVSWLCLL